MEELPKVMDEENFKFLFENSAIPQSLTEIDGKIHVNKALHNMLGYNEQELQGINWRDITHPDDIELTLYQIDRILTGTISTSRFKKRFIHKDGSIIYTELFTVLKKNNNNEPIFFNTSIVDITAQQNTLDSLIESESRYKQLFENSGTGIIIINREGKYLLVNKKASDRFGVPKEEIEGKSMFEFLDKETSQRYLERNMELLEQGGAREYEDNFDLPIGRRTFLINDTCLLDKTGYAVAFQSSSIDITERKRSEVLNNARQRIMEFSWKVTWKELIQNVLDEAEIITGSEIGFFHFINSEQDTITFQNWSSRTLNEFSTSKCQSSPYPLSKAGSWADCAMDKLPHLVNDYSKVKTAKGLPVGHAELNRYISIPIIRSEKVVAIIGVGNKHYDYNNEDISILSQLADLSWEIIDNMIKKEKVENIAKELKETQRYAKIGTWEWDIIAKTMYWSDELMNIFQIDQTNSSVKFEDIIEYVHKEDRAKISKYFFDIQAGKDPSPIEHRIILPDQSVRYVFIKPGELTRNEQDQPIRLKGYFQEVSESALIRESLIESEEKFRNAFDYAGFGIAMVSMEGYFIKVNPALQNILGYTEEEFLKLRTLDIVRPEKINDAKKRGIELLSGNSNFITVEQEYLHKDGRFITGKLITSLVRSSNNEPLYFIVQIEDITESKQALETIKKGRERYFSLLEQASDGIFHGDLEGRFQLVNTAGCQMLGYEKEDLLNMKIKDIVLENELAVNPLKFDQMIKGNTVISERTLIKKDGSLLPVEISGKCIDGNTFQGIVRDISERKKTENKLNEKINELERFNNLTIDRELKMVELKKEINELLVKAGQNEKYKIVT